MYFLGCILDGSSVKFVNIIWVLNKFGSYFFVLVLIVVVEVNIGKKLIFILVIFEYNRLLLCYGIYDFFYLMFKDNFEYWIIFLLVFRILIRLLLL